MFVSDDGSERRCLSNRVGCAARRGYVLAGQCLTEAQCKAVAGYRPGDDSKCVEEQACAADEYVLDGSCVTRDECLSVSGRLLYSEMARVCLESVEVCVLNGLFVRGTKCLTKEQCDWSGRYLANADTHTCDVNTCDDYLYVSESGETTCVDMDECVRTLGGYVY